MNLPCETHAGARIVRPAGRIGHDNAEEFRVALEPHLTDCGDGRRLVLDLAGLEYVSSAGLRVFMLAAKQAKARGGQVVVAALQPVVREIFEISRFNLVFEVFDTVDAALAAAPPA